MKVFKVYWNSLVALYIEDQNVASVPNNFKSIHWFKSNQTVSIASLLFA